MWHYLGTIDLLKNINPLNNLKVQGKCLELSPKTKLIVSNMINQDFCKQKMLHLNNKSNSDFAKNNLHLIER